MKYLLLLTCLFIVISMQAQEKNESGNSPKTTAFIRIGDTGNHTYLLPEFYYVFPKHNRDTTWKFECYDSRDSIMNMDTVHNINEAHFFSVFKSYTDSAHSYIDNNGKRQFLPISGIIQRYDRVGKDNWMTIDYSDNKYSALREFPQIIVRVDTTIIVDPVTGREQSAYYKYYKVSIAK